MICKSCVYYEDFSVCKNPESGHFGDGMHPEAGCVNWEADDEEKDEECEGCS